MLSAAIAGLLAVNAPRQVADGIAAAALQASDDPKSLIRRGETASANRILEARVARDPSDVEANFLLGMMAIESLSYRQAIQHLRAALIYAPEAPRIRLELARAYYLHKDYDNAMRQFRLVKAGHLPNGVDRTIDQFIAAIRHDRRFSYQFGFAIAPDTNINGGTSSHDTVLFGLPFELGKDARRRSGVGVASNAGVEFEPHLTETLSVRLGSNFNRRDYKSTRFDDTALAVFAGPRIAVGKWDASLLVTGLMRWYGGGLYQRAVGTRIEAVTYLSARTALSGEAAIQRFEYPTARSQDGQVYSASVGALRVFGPSSSASARGGMVRQKARAAGYSNWGAILQLGYTRDIRGGFTITVEPSAAFIKYDAPDPLFGIRRRDRAQEVRVTSTNRKILWWNFSPQLIYTYSRRRSSIDLYNSDQSRVEVGLTTNF